MFHLIQNSKLLFTQAHGLVHHPRTVAIASHQGGLQRHCSVFSLGKFGALHKNKVLYQRESTLQDNISKKVQFWHQKFSVCGKYESAKTGKSFVACFSEVGKQMLNVLFCPVPCAPQTHLSPIFSAAPFSIIM